MTDEWIIERAKEAEKRDGFSTLVGSEKSQGVNSAYGIGFIDGMTEYRDGIWHSAKEKPKDSSRVLLASDEGYLLMLGYYLDMDNSVHGKDDFFYVDDSLQWAYLSDILPFKTDEQRGNRYV